MRDFEPEKPPETQIAANVVNYNGGRNLAKKDLAQFPPDKLRFTDNRIYLKPQGNLGLLRNPGPEFEN